MRTSSLTKKVIGLLLVLSFVVGLLNMPIVPGVWGAERVYAKDSETQKAYKLCKKVYLNLNPDGRKLFKKLLEMDEELYEFHVKNVDRQFERVDKCSQKARRGDWAIVPRELVQLGEELHDLNLPFYIYYSLMAIGSGIMAAAADGPIPVGDIVGAFVGVCGVGVIALNWPKIEKKWPDIEAAFARCFSSMSKNVKKAFSKLKVKIEVRYYSHDFKDFEYHFKAHSEEFANKPGGNGKKPSRKQYYKMAKKFRKSENSADVLQGTDVNHADRGIKFNRVTLEYLVYEKGTNKIISYYLPKWENMINNGWSVERWAKAALNYAKNHIK